MTLQVKEKLVKVGFVEIEQNYSDKNEKWERAQAKMENFLNNLNKKPKPVKKNLDNLFKKAQLNTNFPDDVVSIQEIRYHQIYRMNGIF